MALNAPKKVKKDEKEGAPAPRFKKWETVKVVKAADFEAAYKKLGEVEKTEWVPDNWARGSNMSFNKEKDCAWRRRMSKDGKHFARVVHFSEGFALQRGILANPIDLSDNSDSDDEGGATKTPEEPAVAAPAAAPAQGGKKKAEAPAKDKKDKDQGSSSQATPAPGEEGRCQPSASASLCRNRAKYAGIQNRVYVFCMYSCVFWASCVCILR